MFHRADSHMDKLKGWDHSNFMLRHNIMHHAEDDPQNNNYLWYPTHFFDKPLDREVMEAILIKEAMEKAACDPNHVVLNGKAEYNRNILPGITQTATEEDRE